LAPEIVFAAAPVKADALAVGLRPDLKTAQSWIAQALAGKHRFKGEEGDVLPILTPDGWFVAVGLDAEDDQDACSLRRVGSALFAELCDGGIEHLCLDMGLDMGLSPQDSAELAYGIALRAWRPSDKYRSKLDPDEAWSLSKITIVTSDVKAAQTYFARLDAVATGLRYARDLVVAPGNELTPQGFVTRLEELFPLGIQVEVLDAKALRKQGLNLLLAVGQGSTNPPLLAVLRWNGGKKNAAPLAFVGKGITFDTGGISIKDGEDMEEMKGDMGGAATVAGLMMALALRKAPVNAVGVLAIAENMPSGTATRPGDVVTGYNGTTVEIVDTDAEGRLALADALAWTAKQCEPSLMVDLATLTGAVEVALGKKRAGLFTASDKLAKRLMQAGEDEDELLWRLPLVDFYDEGIKSAAADLRNCSWDDLCPDHLQAARFLQHFVPKSLAWAHLDIAGLSEAGDDEDGDEPLTGPGPTGFGIRLLDRLADKG